jgi:hypothetical protein
MKAPERLFVLPYSSVNRYVFNIEAQQSRRKRERLCSSLRSFSLPVSGNSNREQGLRLGAVSTRSSHRRGTIDLNHARKENLFDLSPLNAFWQAHTTHNANCRGRIILPLDSRVTQTARYQRIENRPPKKHCQTSQQRQRSASNALHQHQRSYQQTARAVLRLLSSSP